MYLQVGADGVRNTDGREISMDRIGKAEKATRLEMRMADGKVKELGCRENLQIEMRQRGDRRVFRCRDEGFAKIACSLKVAEVNIE